MILPPSAHQIRHNASMKRWLIRLNRDLDAILVDLRQRQNFDPIRERSHLASTQEISPFLLAVLALEDRQFFKHSGIELRIVPRMLRQLIKGKRVGGVSTIDQQVVRISRARFERTSNRKISELLLAFLLNFHLSKADLLYYYVNQAYFGYRLTGCDPASRLLFGISAVEESPEQGAVLAAMLARPLPRQVYEVFSSDRPLMQRTTTRVRETVYAKNPSYAEKLFRRARYCEAVSSNMLKSRRIR